MTFQLDNPMLAFPQIGAWEIGIILAIVLLLFGGKKLPELARGLARGMRNFRDELRGVKTDLEDIGEEEPQKLESDAPKPAAKAEPQDQTAEQNTDQTTPSE